MRIQIDIRKSVEKLFLKIEKRLRFVIATLVMGGLIITSSFFDFDKFWLFIPVFIVSSYFLTYFAVLEGIEKNEWFMLFLMPVLFVVGFYLFYFLFPIRWLTRVPFLFIFGVSYYAILLTSNIFNVGVEKNLQLHRAAFSVNYFYQSLLLFLIANVLFSFKQNFLVNGVVVFAVVLPLAMQLLWTVKLEHTFDRMLFNYSLFIAVLLAELTVIISFVPMKATLMSLLITAGYYSLSGLMYHYIDLRLFQNVIKEYIAVFIIVSVLVILSISW